MEKSDREPDRRDYEQCLLINRWLVVRNAGVYMDSAVIQGALGLTGVIVGVGLSRLLSGPKVELEIRKLKAEIDRIEIENRKLSQETDDLNRRNRALRERISSNASVIQRYLEDLQSDVNSVRTGLGLGRPIALDQIYVWMRLENGGEQKRVEIGDIDLLQQLIGSTECQRCAIIGGPGTGKSTIVRRWASNIAQMTITDSENALLPLLVPLTMVVQLWDQLEGLTPRVEEVTLRYLYGEACDEMPELSAALTSSLESGRAAIFLDAADEVPEDAREFVATWISQLTIRTSGCLIVLTSRPCSFADRLLDCFKKYDIVGFNERQIREFVSRWFSVAGGSSERVSKITDFVLSSERVIKSNPLFLTMLCVVVRKGTGGTCSGSSSSV